MEYLSISIHNYFNTENLKTLNDAQIVTVLDFLNCATKTLEKITSLPLREILEIRKELLNTFSSPRSGYDYYKSIITDFAIIPTGIQRLDNLLEGGLFTGNIYEICGLPASGKTLFCLTLLKNVAPTSNNILYLDTKHDFLGVKMKQLLSSLNKEEVISVLNKIHVTRVNTQSELIKMLLSITKSIESGESIKLVIIDSLSPVSFQSSDQTENNAFLCYVANILHYLAKEYNVVFIVTNLMTLWNDGDFKNISIMREKISCGSYWYGVPNVRIILKKKDNICTMKLLKTIKFLPEVNYCDTYFTDEGLV